MVAREADGGGMSRSKGATGRLLRGCNREAEEAAGLQGGSHLLQRLGARCAACSDAFRCELCPPRRGQGRALHSHSMWVALGPPRV